MVRRFSLGILIVVIGFSTGFFGMHAFAEEKAHPEVKLAIRKASTLAVRPVPSVAPSKMTAIAASPNASKTTSKVTSAAPKVSAQKKVANTIVIPRMGVNTEILEGPDEKTLNKGIWRIPGTSNPAKGGNVVISAHRYKWRPPSTKTFWDIDKMKEGDLITITWEGKKYVYKVAKTYTVTPDKVEILENTTEHKLTLFSCTPKFTSKYRLVVEAYPV